MFSVKNYCQVKTTPASRGKMSAAAAAARRPLTVGGGGVTKRPAAAAAARKSTLRYILRVYVKCGVRGGILR